MIEVERKKEGKTKCVQGVLEKKKTFRFLGKTG